jgi:hypothetical protein
MEKYDEALQDLITVKEKGVAVDENMINELKIKSKPILSKGKN